MPDSLCIFQQQDMMIAYLRLDGPTRWHASISEGSILSPISSKNFSAVFFQRTIGHSLWNAKTFTFGVLLITPRFSFSLNHLVMQNVDLLYDSKFSFKFGDVFSQFREVFVNTSQILITFILIIKSKFNNLFHGKLFMSRLFYAISIKKQACVTY